MAYFHINIHSLSLHFKKLHALLSSLKINFQLMGLSEIMAYNIAPLESNIDLPGYDFYPLCLLSAAVQVMSYNQCYFCV